MNHLKNYVSTFFNELEMYEDVARGHSYKAYIHEAVRNFLEDENKAAAFEVYHTFFDSYRIILAGETNPFIDLLDMLKSYEEKASVLIAKHRDHYVHSVNVFILGIAIYARNESFRRVFAGVILDKAVYPDSYDTSHEEFFYRWGLAALFHDVGYPAEITAKQINSFIEFVTRADKEKKIKAYLNFENFEELNFIAEVIPKREFTRIFYERYESCAYVDLLKPIDLLAVKLNLSLGINVEEIKYALDSYVDDMARYGFVDHGFYSSLIVLKWYGFLIQSCKYKPDYFFYPVLDSASAILLHNYYKNNMIHGKRFNLGPLSPESHPIAYLIILCDELQEWNREAYGILDKKLTHAAEASLVISDKRLDITYIAKKGTMPEEFAAKKEEEFNKVLHMNAIFADGFSIGCETMDTLASLADRAKKKSGPAPRPLLDNLEKLAIAIHELYNQRQLERYPDQPLKYPCFSNLTDSLKYSNLRQARDISDKLELLDCEMRPIGSPGDVITGFDEETLEYLSACEHGAWMKERLESGWIYGEKIDETVKTSPYLIPYEKLPEEIKELDRDTIRNIPMLLENIGMAVYKKTE